MSQIYQLSSFGPSPVTLEDMKTYLKVTSTVEDILIQTLIDSATEFGEKYTGREFRANTWELLLDAFSDFDNSSERFQHEHIGNHASVGVHSGHFVRFTDRIELKRDPVDTVTSITYLDDAGGTSTVPDVDFYLKKNTQSSEILLFDDKNFPTDIAEREQAISVLFVTKAYRCINEIVNSIKLHVSNLYTNRGDCKDSKEAAVDSGAVLFYDQFRISRV